MLDALFRKARADIAGRPLQMGLVFVIVTIATAVLAVAATTYVSADRAYLTRFEQGNGAHIWFSTNPTFTDPSDLMRIGEMTEVTATSGLIPYVSTPFPVLLDDVARDLRLYGLPSVLPEVGKPIVTRGRWLSPAGDREIVLDNGLARAQGIEVGDQLEVLSGEATETFEIVGLFVAAEHLSYPHTSYAAAYVLPSVLEMMQPDHDKWGWKYGVRVQDPEAAGAFARTVWQTYREGQKPSLITWKANRDEVNEEVRLYAVFIGVFGIFAVGVAAFVIVNVVAGNVVAQFRDIGLLKSVGFTPRQVTSLLLAEHVGVGLLAAVLAVAIGYAAAPLALRVTGNYLGMPASAVFDYTFMVAIVLGVSLAIAATALVPSWHGGGVSTVQALTSGSPRPLSGACRASRLATFLRLPAVVVVGVKDVFNRPVRSVLTITALVVAVILATFAMGMEATLRGIIEDPRLSGGDPYEVTVVRHLGADEMSPAEVRELLDGRPEVHSHFGGRGLVGDLENSSGGPTGLNKILIGAPGEGYANLAPYIPEGRLFIQPGEAIITRRLAEERGLGIGDSFAFVIDGQLSGDMEMDGEELNLRVVGIYVDDATEARISLDTLSQQLGLDVDPTHYRIKVARGADPEALRVALLREAGDRLYVTVSDAHKGNENTAGYVRPPLYALTAALLAIGAGSVLITLLFAVRERYREFGILKALGFTPRQIMASVATGPSLLAAMALVVGTPLGIVITRLSLNYIGSETGVGAPFGSMPGPLGIVLLIPLILLIALLGSVLPARRAAAITVNEALKFD